jgi:hypothetical protein
MDTIDEVEVKCCIACDTTLHSDDDGTTTSNGNPVCESCMIMCIHCEAVITVDDEYNDVEGELWCQRCTRNDAHWCDLCDTYFTGYTFGVDDSNDTMCERCYENNTSYCEDCDSTYLNGCDVDHDGDSRLIHDYSYRPDPIFYKMASEDSNRLYFGIEIETEVRGQGYGERTTAAEYAYRLEVERLAYLKSDGSLECGFEIVTHPMSHAFMTDVDNPLWHVLTTLKRDYNMMSWGTRTCGLHVHISRNGFSGGSHQHRFLQLVYNNKEFYELLAGRSASHWAKFDDVVDPDTGKKTFKGKFDRHGSDRYSAVNTNNRNTLEMRIFRGSLNPRFVKSAVNLAHASVEYTRVMSVQEVRDNALSTLKFVEYIESKPDLYQSLNERIVIHKDIIQRIGRREHVSVGSVFTE